MSRSLMWRGGCLGFALLMAACSAKENIRQAEAAVQQFHRQLDAGEMAALYDASSDEMKMATTEQRWVQLLDAVHRKLGLTQSATEDNWRVDYRSSGRFVSLSYRTVFAGGDAAEQFIYRLNDQGPQLVGYQINSNALILK